MSNSVYKTNHRVLDYPKNKYIITSGCLVYATKKRQT